MRHLHAIVMFARIGQAHNNENKTNKKYATTTTATATPTIQLLNVRKSKEKKNHPIDANGIV